MDDECAASKFWPEKDLPSGQPGEASDPWLYRVVGVGVGESIGEKLDAMDGHPLEPNDSTSIASLSDMLYSDLISSLSSVSWSLW